MSSHKGFTAADFKGIEVRYNWSAFNVLVAVCVQVKKKESVKNAQELPLIRVNKLSGKKTSVRETEKKKSFKYVRESQSDEQERPIKKLRFFYHPQETETETEEIIKEKRKRVSVSRPAPVLRVNNKKIGKVQKEELARILAQKYDLPKEFREKIKNMNQTGEAKLVIQKMLFEADISDGANRFSIPLKQLCCTDFLTEEEKRLVEGRTEDYHMKNIKVKVIEPEELEVGEANFTKWDMSKVVWKVNQTYVLNGGWKDIRSRNHLEAGMVMQLWSFRDVEGDLCFALVKLPIDLNKCLNLD